MPGYLRFFRCSPKRRFEMTSENLAAVGVSNTLHSSHG